MSQTAVPLVLTDDDRAELARWSQAGCRGLAERAQIALACSEPGSGVAREAAQLGSTRMTVRKWRRRFAEDGLFAASNIADGRVIYSPHRRHRAAEFKKFLLRIDKAVPAGLGVHLVRDNLATHQTPAIQVLPPGLSADWFRDPVVASAAMPPRGQGIEIMTAFRLDD
jgi:hypothetical protein